MVGTDEIERALAGEPAAGRALMQQLLPHVQKRVCAALMRRAAAGRGRVVRQEVLDLTQEVFVALLKDDGKVLRTWDPQREASLNTFVGRVAERRVASIMRSARRSPWTETPTESASLERVSGQARAPEALVGDREELAAVLDLLRATLSPLGFDLFRDIVVEQRTVEEICSARSMSADAVYAWRSRLRKAMRKALLQVRSETGVPRRRGG